MNKKYLALVAAGAVALATVGTIAISTVSAATTPANSPMANLVAAIAQRFNLNPSDVQKVFDDQKAAREQQMQQKFTDKISAAVTAGKITQDQANKILAKVADLQSQEASFKASLQGKTKAEIQTAIKSQMDALKQWATDNDIPLQYIWFGGMKGPHGFGIKPHGAGFWAK